MKLLFILLLLLGGGGWYFLNKNPKPLAQTAANKIQPIDAENLAVKETQYIPIPASADAIEQLQRQNSFKKKQAHIDSSLDSLSSKYIEARIEAQRELFQNCQKNTLRKNKFVIGDILIGFSISPLGSVDAVKILNSTLKHKDMKHCILNVFNRIKFKHFKGEAIYFSYPLSFK